MDKSQYSEKWQARFTFFEQHGAPKASEYSAAIKAESFGRRILLNMNFIAFFFGFIYFFVLGLWRKNLALFGIAVVVGILLGIIESILNIEISPVVSMSINCAFAAIWGITANYAYYLKEKVNSQSWNPFEGFF